MIVIALRWVPESGDAEADAQTDWLGASLATLGLGGLTFGLIESSHRGWRDPWVLGALALGIVALPGFLAVEARSAHPMMPFSVFRSRAFSGANLLTLWLYAALGGALFFFPFNLIQVQGYSATAAGAAFLPFIAVMFLLSRWSGALAAASFLAAYRGVMLAIAGLALLASLSAWWMIPGKQTRT